MKKWLLPTLFSTTLFAQPIELQQGDFVKGEFITQQNADLAIQFADNQTRLLARNVFGRREFMFKTETAGTAQFWAMAEGKALDKRAYSVHILQHLPVKQQLAQPEALPHPLLREFAKNSPEDTARFWQEVAKRGTPLVEAIDENQNRITFLYRGARENVRIFGGVSHDHDFMQRLGNSDIWYKSYVVPNDTRVAYKLAPDVPQLPVNEREQRRAILSTAQADPFNKTPYFERVGDSLETVDKYNYASQVILPNAVQPRFLQPDTTQKGSLQTFVFESKTLANQRRLFVYLPHHFKSDEAYPVLYLFDGMEYTQQVPVPTMLDNMIAQGKIPPMAAVFIENPSNQARAKELPPNPQFAKVLADELVPFIERKAGLQAKSRIIGGSSFGGLASAYLSLTYPQTFPQALVLSGSFWWQPKSTPAENSNFIAHQFASREKLPICLFISAGHFEDGENSILANSRQLKDVLTAKGYPFIYREYSTEHGYAAWQGILSEGLEALFKQCRRDIPFVK